MVKNIVLIKIFEDFSLVEGSKNTNVKSIFLLFQEFDAKLTMTMCQCQTNFLPLSDEKLLVLIFC